MDYLDPRTFQERVQRRSLTHVACPDIYLRIVFLCIRAYYHQSVSTPSAITA